MPTYQGAVKHTHTRAASSIFEQLQHQSNQDFLENLEFFKSMQPGMPTGLVPETGAVRDAGKTCRRLWSSSWKQGF